MSTKSQKSFGKYVRAFFGHMNGSPLRPFVGVSPNDNAEFGEWLTPKDAERFANNILKAVAFLRKEKEP